MDQIVSTPTPTNTSTLPMDADRCVTFPNIRIQYAPRDLVLENYEYQQRLIREQLARSRWRWLKLLYPIRPFGTR